MPTNSDRVFRKRRASGGRLVAFEGLDGSGKSTQVNLLLKLLEQERVKHEHISFPRTSEPGYGEAIGMFLRGEFGVAESANPYLIAALFAGDRAGAKPILDDWLSKGRLVLVDRYFYSNLAFQSAKLSNSKERQHFRAWIRRIEFEYHRIPDPDVTFFFDVPFDFVRANIRKRPKERRSYLNGLVDVHESDLALQERVALEYRSFGAKDHSFCTISCATAAGQMRSPQNVHQEILRMLRAHQVLLEPVGQLDCTN